MNLEIGTLTVVITHNAVIAEMADRVIHLRDGRIASITQNRTRKPVGELEW